MFLVGVGCSVSVLGIGMEEIEWGERGEGSVSSRVPGDL